MFKDLPSPRVCLVEYCVSPEVVLLEKYLLFVLRTASARQKALGGLFVDNVNIEITSCPQSQRSNQYY